MVMRITVVGLGYVGSVVAGCLAKQGHDVIGVDVERSKVDRLNAGRAPIVEPDIDGIVAEAVAAGRLSAVSSAAEAVEKSDVALICVGTPGRANGDIDLTYIRRVCEEIGSSLRSPSGAPLIVVRSTVLPGTTRQIVTPTLEAVSGNRAGVDFGVCFNPEFLREGTAVHDFFNPPKTVIGELNRPSGDVLAALYSNINAPLIRTDLETAEMIKYTDNAWHALKIGFANEIGNICKGLGIDSHQLMHHFCQDRKLNISPSYLKPGFAFGGLCLPKDLRALMKRASTLDLSLPILQAILPSNEQQLARGVRAVIDAGHRRVGILGLSFKAGTDDLRESPIVELAERLIGKGFDLRIYDRNVTLAKVTGTNRDYLLNRIPHVGSLLVPSVDDVLDHADTIVIGNADPEFENLPGEATDGRLVIDLVRVRNTRTVAGEYEGICW
jgi:GDP-mannose 6-dehydrogenase